MIFIAGKQKELSLANEAHYERLLAFSRKDIHRSRISWPPSYHGIQNCFDKILL